jgi:hypothetical protein
MLAMILQIYQKSDNIVTNSLTLVRELVTVRTDKFGGNSCPSRRLRTEMEAPNKSEDPNYK